MSSPVTWRPLKDWHFTSCFYLFFLCVYRGIRRGTFTSRNGCFVMYTGQTTQPACWSNILTVILGHMKFNNTMYKLDIHCTDLCQRPMCNINVNIPCTNLHECPTSNMDVQDRHSLIWMSNVQYGCYMIDIHWTQTYMNVQHPIWMYRIDIHCTNLHECPTSNMDTVQDRQSLYKPNWMSNFEKATLVFAAQTYVNVQHLVSN